MNASSLIPILRVKDARASERFYVEQLGFAKEWEHQFSPGFPLMMALSHGAMKLVLSEHTGTGTDAADLYAYVADVDGFYRSLLAKAVAIEQSPTDQPWGVRDLQIRDPDGHRFTFATRKTAVHDPARSYVDLSFEKKAANPPPAEATCTRTHYIRRLFPTSSKLSCSSEDFFRSAQN